MERLVDLARRAKTQAPPPWVVWESLRDPWASENREWFQVRPGEVPPTILDGVRPSLIVWTSIWADHPELRIRFDIEPAGTGSLVTWTLQGRQELDDDDVRGRRHRLNQLINGNLRETFDQ
ncbi:MAG: hypothetical protein ABR511_05455 [Acidimicrobiales bacterium]